MTINGLDSRILALAGVEKEGEDAFKIEGHDFVKQIAPGRIQLFLTDACEKKLYSALRAEPRASFDNTPKGWVTLNYNDDVDVEFVFLYVRYSWKFIRADLA
jgi:hypothetical protein